MAQRKKAEEMKHLIAIAGLKGSGKTTISNHLVSMYSFTKIPFAEPMKSMLLEFGLSPDELWGESKEKPSDKLFEKTPRHAMQTLGTEWGRQMIHEDIWVRAWIRRVKAQTIQASIIVDDLRFPNELRTIKALGGFVWIVKGPETSKIDTHISESVPSNFDYDFEIYNTGTFQDLYKIIDDRMKILLG